MNPSATKEREYKVAFVERNEVIAVIKGRMSIDDAQKLIEALQTSRPVLLPPGHQLNRRQGHSA